LGSAAQRLEQQRRLVLCALEQRRLELRVVERGEHDLVGGRAGARASGIRVRVGVGRAVEPTTHCYALLRTTAHCYALRTDHGDPEAHVRIALVPLANGLHRIAVRRASPPRVPPAEVGPGEVEVRAALLALPCELQPLLQRLHLGRALRERARSEQHLQRLGSEVCALARAACDRRLARRGPLLRVDAAELRVDEPLLEVRARGGARGGGRGRGGGRAKGVGSGLASGLASGLGLGLGLASGLGLGLGLARLLEVGQVLLSLDQLAAAAHTTHKYGTAHAAHAAHALRAKHLEQARRRCKLRRRGQKLREARLEYKRSMIVSMRVSMRVSTIVSTS
jgi:hypothetical protein